MTPQARYSRWRKAKEAMEQGCELASPEEWSTLYHEEQAAWDDMADHDDPEYVRILEES